MISMVKGHLSCSPAQSLKCRALEDSQKCRRLTIATGNKQCKQINKQYLMTKQIVPKDSTPHCKHVSVRIIQIGAMVKKL
jgi:hypothetical protein